jgi:glycerophosphoryl diester phosphodiesterase
MALDIALDRDLPSAFLPLLDASLGVFPPAAAPHALSAEEAAFRMRKHWQALRDAIRTGKVRIAQALAAGLRLQQAVDLPDRSGWTALGLALFYGHRALLDDLRPLQGKEAGPSACAEPQEAAVAADAEAAVAGEASAPVRVRPPLRAGAWELRLEMGTFGTVTGSRPHPALLLLLDAAGTGQGGAGGVPLEGLGDAAAARIDIHCLAAASTQPRAAAAEAFPVTAPKHWQRAFTVRAQLTRDGPFAAACRGASPVLASCDPAEVSGRNDVRAAVDPQWQAAHPDDGADGGQVLVITGSGLTAQAMRFDVSLPEVLSATASSASTATASGGAAEAQWASAWSALPEYGPRGPRDAGCAVIGSAHLPAHLFTSSSMLHTATYGVGLDNLGGLSAAGESVRLCGQMVLPVVGAGIVVGYVGVRYLFVRAYEPPTASVAVAATAASHKAASTLGAATTAPVAASRPERPLLSPSSHDFWTDRTHVFGHRGSGADNAAAVPAQAAGVVAAVTKTGTFSFAPALAVPAPAAAPAAASEDPLSLFSPTNGKVRRTHVLENTLLSLSTAARSGAELVEFDVQLSRDGIPVVHHDWGVKLPGPAHVRVPVSHLTASQFLSLQPQAMTNEPASDETALARAADAAAVQRRVLSYTRKAKAAAAAAAAAAAVAVADAGNVPLTSPLSVASAPVTSAAPASGALSPSPVSISGASPVVPAQDTQSIRGSSTSELRDNRRKLHALNIDTSAALRTGPRNAGGRAGPGHASASAAPAAAAEVPAASTAGPGVLAGRADKTAFPEPDTDADHRLALSYYFGLRDKFCTLEQVFRVMDPGCGFNIEVKYPTAEESLMFGLRPMERNAYIDRILDVVFATARGRSIMFSSFDPDTCVILARKQNVYPVFFLTEAGTCEPSYFDKRWNSLHAAVSFALNAGLFGIVTDVRPILEAPHIIRHIQERARLVLCSYGRRNNEIEAVKLQQQHRIGAVIVDHVAHITRTLRFETTPSAGSVASSITAASVVAT